jgi:chromosome segregation and condensation protein ScpB
MTTGSLEVLACIAFKQPISQAEIDHLFDGDNAGLVVKLRGYRYYLGVTQAHYPTTGEPELVEGGQLYIIAVSRNIH